jgi:hypothetical protein
LISIEGTEEQTVTAAKRKSIRLICLYYLVDIRVKRASLINFC